jgi:L-lactate utilization protein LutC
VLERDLVSKGNAVGLRARKTILAEIAQRTIEELETNAQLQLQALEYEHVKGATGQRIGSKTKATVIATGNERAATQS